MPDYQNYKLTARHVFKGQAVCNFKSKGEVQHAVWLEFMRRAGKIKRWQHEKTFFLRGAGINSARHSPDFLITTNNDRKIVHEIKDGIYSLAWRNKKKQFEKQHPSIKYVVLRRPGTLPNGVVRKKWCQDLIKKLKYGAIKEETCRCVRLIKKPFTEKNSSRWSKKELSGWVILAVKSLSVELVFGTKMLAGGPINILF